MGSIINLLKKERLSKKTIDGVGRAIEELQAASGMTRITKASNESVTSSTTMQDDDELQFAVDANGIYEINLFLLTSADANLKMAIQIPSLPSVAGSAITNAAIALDGFYANHDGRGFIPINTNGAGQEVNGTNVQAMLRGTTTIKIGSSGGTLKLRWAQSASSSTAGVVAAGSYIEYKKA